MNSGEPGQPGELESSLVPEAARFLNIQPTSLVVPGVFFRYNTLSRFSSLLCLELPFFCQIQHRPTGNIRTTFGCNYGPSNQASTGELPPPSLLIVQTWSPFCFAERLRGDHRSQGWGHRLYLSASRGTAHLLEWQLVPMTCVLVVSLLEVRNDPCQLACQLSQ